MSKPQALILRTAGTNCDQETAAALVMAGADPVILHMNQVLANKDILKDFGLLVIPGGFSYGDDVAAGKILANELRFKLVDALDKFIARGKRVIGICNGFQVLVKAGYLPGPIGRQTSGAATTDHAQTVTLANNDSGQFQCHWVHLQREKSACRWLNHTDLQWDLPIAHGEGKFIPQDSKTLAALENNGQVVFRYSGTNPNGSAGAIAGICNAAGNVVGLMPHPERHVSMSQHPEWSKGQQKNKVPVGLQFFKALVSSKGKIG